MKKITASVCLLSSIASILWILLYTLVNDLAQSPFGEAGAWTLKLFVPAVIFAFSCLGYVRTRRSMDKEKIRKIQNSETALRNISSTLMQIVYRGLNQCVDGQKIIFEVSPAQTAELHSYCLDFLKHGGDMERIPAQIRAFIAVSPKSTRSRILP